MLGQAGCLVGLGCARPICQWAEVVEELDELGPKVRRGTFGRRAARLYQPV